MDQLAPSKRPVHGTRAEGRGLWRRCADRGRPVVAIRDAERGFVVRDDLKHLDGELSDSALRGLREHVRSLRS